jgi:ferredoxin-NADP reductase
LVLAKGASSHSVLHTSISSEGTIQSVLHQFQQKGQVTVFYCGNPQLGEAVRKKAEKFGFQFRKEVF